MAARYCRSGDVRTREGQNAAMGDWRGKDDLELTGEDIGQMIADGTPVSVHGPRHVPPSGVLGGAVATYGVPTKTLVHPTAVTSARKMRSSHPVAL